MRRAMMVLATAALLTLAGCGDDDEENGGNGGSGGTGGGVLTSSEDAGASTTVPDAGCTEAYPHSASPPEGYVGYAELCGASSGYGWRIKNVSSGVVLSLTSSRAALKQSEIAAPPQTLTAAAVRYVAPAACNLAGCTVPPGASVTMRAFAPFAVNFAVAADTTVAAGITTVLVDKLAGYVTNPSIARLQRVAACGQQAAEAATSDYWQQAFRHAATSAFACKGVIDDLVNNLGGTQTSTIDDVLNKARSLSGGTWQDALLLLAKTLRYGP